MTSAFAKALIADFLRSPVVPNGLPAENLSPYSELGFFSNGSGYGPEYSIGEKLLTEDQLVGLYSLATEYFRRKVFGLFPEYNGIRWNQMPIGGETRIDGVPYIKSSYTISPYTTRIEWKKKVSSPKVGDENTWTFSFDAVSVKEGSGSYYLGEISGDNIIARNFSLVGGLMDNAIPNSELTVRRFDKSSYPLPSSKSAIVELGSATSDPDFWYTQDLDGNLTYQDFSRALDGVAAYLVICGTNSLTTASSVLQQGAVVYSDTWISQWGRMMMYGLEEGYYTRYGNYIPANQLTLVDKARYEYQNSLKTEADRIKFVTAWKEATENDAVLDYYSKRLDIEPAQIFSIRNKKSFPIALKKGKQYHLYLVMHNYLREKSISAVSYQAVKGDWTPLKIGL